MKFEVLNADVMNMHANQDNGIGIWYTFIGKNLLGEPHFTMGPPPFTLGPQIRGFQSHVCNGTPSL